MISFSCAENPIVTNNTEKINSSDNLTLSKETKKLKKPISFHKIKDSVSVRSQPCGYKYEQGWTIRNYLPKPGKTVGMWVYNLTPTWSEYKNNYGFTFIVLGADLYSFNYAKNTVGFGDNTAVQISRYSDVDAIVNNFNSKYYYIDEPLENQENKWTIAQVIQTGITINTVRPGAKLIISSCMWPSLPYFTPPVSYGAWYRDILNGSSNIVITVDKYSNEFCPFCVTPEDYWDEFKDCYGNRFIGGWLHAKAQNTTSGSGKSFTDILSNANNLGINFAFLYGLDAPYTDYSDVENFCYGAWYCGWLRGIAEYTTIVWRCALANPCNCDPSNPDDPWYIEQVIYSGVTFEVYP